jgi:hypothetical protein
MTSGLDLGLGIGKLALPEGLSHEVEKLWYPVGKCGDVPW